MTQKPGIVRVAGWRRFPWLRAGFSSREGGESKAYSGGDGEQNLGWTAEDDPAIVAANRQGFLRAVVGTGTAAAKLVPELVTVQQFHSGIVQLVERRDDALVTPEGKAILRGDGLMTRERGLMLGVQTADCVPVLVADTRTRAVAAFHAGWRGTLARIVEHGVERMRREFGSEPKDLVAAVGPAIGPCCFAVGAEVREQFEIRFGYAGELFREVEGATPQIYMNLWEANRRQLLDAGLKADAIEVAGECTACAVLMNNRRKYFSHRAEHGSTGRMLSVIRVEGN